MIYLFIQSRKILLSINRLEYLLNSRQLMLWRLWGGCVYGNIFIDLVKSVCNISLSISFRPPWVLLSYGVTWPRRKKKRVSTNHLALLKVQVLRWQIQRVDPVYQRRKGGYKHPMALRLQSLGEGHKL